MENLEDYFLFNMFCRYCRLFSEGVCDAGSVLCVHGFIDSDITGEFDKCFKPIEKEKTGD